MLFIPLSDDNPLRFIRYQWVTIGIIAVNVIVFILQIAGLGLAVGASFAVIPSELLQVRIVYGPAHGPFDTIAVPEAWTLVTYMFLHTDVIHLASNMMFLWVFGDNVEDAMGHIKYLAFYLLCGVAAALAQTMMQPTSQLPLIGASGAVAGTIAAYLILHPRVLVWVLAFRVIPLRVTATWILGLWVATQLFMILINRGDQVAWWAHIGGVVAGSLLIPLMRRPGIPLFDRGAQPTDVARRLVARVSGRCLPSRPLAAAQPRPLGDIACEIPPRDRQSADPLGRSPTATRQGHPVEARRRWFGRRSREPQDIRHSDFRAARGGLCARSHPSGWVPLGDHPDGGERGAPGSPRPRICASGSDRQGRAAAGRGRDVRSAYCAMNANLRIIEILLTILERGGGRFDFPTTERRARALASKLVERADRIAKAPAKPAKEFR